MRVYPDPEDEMWVQYVTRGIARHLDRENGPNPRHNWAAGLMAWACTTEYAPSKIGHHMTMDELRPVLADAGEKFEIIISRAASDE